MRHKLTPLFTALGVAALACSAAIAQQSTSSQAIPDAPQATAEATTLPNGPSVVMDTSMGRITCQFYQKQAPNAVANFIGLATGTKDWTDPTTNKVMHHKPFFDNTTFHRVIPEFMIQGGDPTGTGTGGPGYAFDDEFDPGLNFDRPGRLAMANSGPNTNGSQFFITEVPYESLNQHYTLFGQCDDSSVSVVQAIARVGRDGNDKPLTPVVLKKVTIVPEGQQAPAPAAAGAAKRVSIGPGVAAAMLLKRTPPVYPEKARQAGISGTVELQAVISKYGTVTDLKVISGPEELQQAALDAVRNWVYKPYLLNDEPVEVTTTIKTVFSLNTPR
jgi:peptidyl-prolyl cis-trans isomerase A (cyclophilin A)